MRLLRALSLALVVLGLLACPVQSQARSFTCDYYDVVDMPDAWEVSIAPGLNQKKASMGYYVNKETSSSVFVQIGETTAPTTLEELTESLITRLGSQGITILSTPVHEGALMRIEATATGTPATIWVGTNGDVMALTIASGKNREDAFSFFDYMHNQDPVLLPDAGTIRRDGTRP